MPFSFKFFTQTEDSTSVGIFCALTFIPWVDNTDFQVASRQLNEDIEISSDDNNVVFTNNSSIRSQFLCHNSLHRIDRYGFVAM